MNTINLTGNICNDLEIKCTPSGKKVLSCNLAVKRPFTKDTTDFIPLIMWEQSAEHLGRYGRKGSRVAVSGKLTTRKWQDKDGNNRTQFEVVCDTVELMDGKNDSQTNENVGSIPYIPDAYKSQQNANFMAMDDDDDMPF